MASSGSFVCGGGYSSKTLLFEWWTNSRDIGANRTNIGYRLKGYNGSGYHVSGNFYLSINGTQVYYSSTRINLYNGTVITEGSFDIYHNSDGTKYFEAYAEAGIYTVAVNCTGSGGWTLDSIPRYPSITGATDFNDEGNPSLTFSNVGVYPIKVKIEAGGNTKLITRDISQNATSYTFSLTEAERNTLRSLASSSNSLSVTITVCAMSGSTELSASYLGRTMTIVNATPTFAESNISYLDSNTTITAITGNNQHIVRNQSNLKVTFTGATAKKQASISKYDITFNGATQTKTAPSTIDYGIVNSANNLTVSIKVTDSRGNTVTSSKTITIFDWVNPTAIISAGRVNNYEDNTKIKANVTISSVNSKNAIQSIQYRYKKTADSTYSSYANLTNNTQITISINKLYSWDFQIVIKDKFGTTTYNLVIAKGMPIMFFDVNKISVGVNKFPEYNNSLETTFIYANDNINIIKDNACINLYNTQKKLMGKVRMNTTGAIIISSGNDGTQKEIYLRPNSDSDTTNQFYLTSNKATIGGAGIRTNHILTGYIDRHKTNVSTAWSMVDFGTITQLSKVGTKLSISGGNIVIGAGVSIIQVSFTCQGIDTSIIGGDKVIQIGRNGSNCGDGYGGYSSGGQGWVPISSGLLVMAVSQNDAIDLRLTSGGTGQVEMLGTTITVEVIE